MMIYMKSYIRILIVMIALMIGVVSGAWAQLTNDDVIVEVKPNASAGIVSASVNATTRVVTLSITPASGYYIKASDIIVEKLVDPGKSNAPMRRISDVTDNIVGKMYSGDMTKEISSVEAGSSANYIFTLPADYDGAYVTATFHLLTEGNIIRITASTNLDNTPDMTAHYVLVEDISASVVGKLYSSTPFTGIFEGEAQADGSFPKITGLSHALFQKVSGGTVKNIVLENVNISGGNIGAIANTLTGTSDKIAAIYNCGVFGSVSGTGCVGSIVGLLGEKNNNDNCYARVINCYSFATVSGGGNSNVGGIVGYNYFASTAIDIRTMVMNCMFYGDITSGNKVSPIYGGLNINNLEGGLNTFNYYAYDKLKTTAITSGKYNCALAVEDKYLNRFEFYRLLLNSNKKLAAFYATGSADNGNQMAKWVLEAADRTISGRTPHPYPILKAQKFYPSIINPDIANAPDSATVGRNKGGRLPFPRRTLTVIISSSKTDGGQTWPSGASLKRTYLELTRTDKDKDRFNFNYDKVQLPYYNEVGEGNYTGNRVVTGWKITAITAIDGDPYTSSNYPTTGIKDYPDHNYADRKSSNKDLYTVSKRVFSQGAYFDVPYGVTSITIEPYWGKAVYIADPNYDVVYYKKDNVEYNGKQNVTQTGTQVENDATFNSVASQVIKTSISDALSYIENSLGGFGSTVYDNAVVLVGNLHLNNVPSKEPNPFTMMSVDKDNDNEPDYSLIYHHINRTLMCPIRFDFLDVIGTAQAQKPNDASLICNMTICRTMGWFEITNTSLMYFSQFEYENLGKNTSGSIDDNKDKVDAPLILLGGVIDQFVSTQSSVVNGKVIYIHVGSNVWINEFGMGTHSDGSKSTPHVPVSVTGGEFPGFYLTGTYNQNATERPDNAECYISGGYFHEAAGASQESIGGNVRWQIYNADIDNFFGGGTNDAHPIKGNITVDIYNSYVTLFCGGPKFGNMQGSKKVTTHAEGCVFEEYFGAGYGGLSYSRKKYYDNTTPQWEAILQGYFTTDRGYYFDGTTTNSRDGGKGDAQYGKKGPGVATDFDYEFFVWSSGKTGGRFFVKFASFSTAQCNDVESKLKKCIIQKSFYGGGNLGKVTGTATSVLDDCEVHGSVYGGGFSAALPTVEVRDGGFTTVPKYNSASGMFEPAVLSGTTTFTWKNAAEAGVTLTNGELGSDLDKSILYTGVNLNTLGQVKKSNLIIMGSTTVTGSVYGGGALASMDENGETKVNLIGGTVNGDVYGGGQGRLPGTKDEHNKELPEVKALVGDANVNLNGLDAVDYKAEYTNLVREGENGPYVVKSNEKGCIVKGCIFGCNNLNGTPKGIATVHIYSTQNIAAATIGNPAEGEKIAKVAGRYDIAAVYGGGNLAAYEPAGDKATTKSTNVIIDGCGLTSIRQVYGGGNAASTPATKVTVNGTFEIEELFGGGNGKDDIVKNNVTLPNPGANVGFYEYADDADNAQTPADRATYYGYGTGKASVNVFGGTIHRVFGGSNTKGNVRQTAVTLLDENSGCDFCVDEAYGGGKSAPMDAEAKLLMSCIPGLNAAYGGAEAAAIQGNVTLNITNGTFDRVFGGNNLSGTINGSITVNIEEIGCKPIKIGELYGGGNQAAYSVYGYDGDGKAIEEGTTPLFDNPQVNVKSFTSIGSIYGGGFGSGATMVGNPTVNINEIYGRWYNDETSVVGENAKTPGDYPIPSHAAGKMGAINNVFGGGNAAKVIGSTNVNIGTQSEVYIVKTVAVGSSVTGLFTRNNDGTYTEATGTAQDGTTYYEQKTVLGADIRGNVYGGGNNAEVTGDANVTVGKRNE